MEDEPQGYDFDPSFKAKDPDEIRFCLLLWDEEQRCWLEEDCASSDTGQGTPWLAILSALTFPLSYRTPGRLH